MASKRFLMVPVASSAARMPLPFAVMASATLFSSARFIRALLEMSIDPLASLLPQNLHPRQRLAFHPFQEGAAGCGDIGELFGHAGHIQGGDRVAAPRDRDELSGFGMG